MAFSIDGRSKSCFQPNGEGGWDFYPWAESRLGYRIDSATKLKLEQIEAKSGRFLGALFAFPCLGLFFLSDLGSRWLAKFAVGLSPQWATALCYILFFVLVRHLSNVVRRQQIDALADLAPATVTLSLEESRRNIARQMFFGHPKTYAIAGFFLIAIPVWGITAGDPSPWKLTALLGFLPGALLVLRAWQLIFSAAKI